MEKGSPNMSVGERPSKHEWWRETIPTWKVKKRIRITGNVSLELVKTSFPKCQRNDMNKKWPVRRPNIHWNFLIFSSRFTDPFVPRYHVSERRKTLVEKQRIKSHHFSKRKRWKQLWFSEKKMLAIFRLSFVKRMNMSHFLVNFDHKWRYIRTQNTNKQT